MAYATTNFIWKGAKARTSETPSNPSSRHFEGNPRHSELTLFLVVTFWEYFLSDFHLHITFPQLFGNIMGGNIGELVNTNFIFSYVKICKITGILRGKTLITLCMYSLKNDKTKLFRL